jgi:hypothetical protein
MKIKKKNSIGCVGSMAGTRRLRQSDDFPYVLYSTSIVWVLMNHPIHPIHPMFPMKTCPTQNESVFVFY